MLKKVLVVDDSELIHNMYRMILKKYHGCTVTSALNGREALNHLATDAGYDLILLDINMPVMNGLQFLETKQDDARIAGIPVIVISTEGKEDDTRRGLRLGASGYLVKPFQSSHLHAIIETVMAKHQAAAG